MTDQDHLERINALTRNARQTWFVLLGALVFVGITLMGVEHIDFYGVDRATDLPLVSVSVPTRYFFYAAPLLIAAIYGYFHLYLIRLWEALDAAPARLNGIRLGDAISPWLMSDAALTVRAWRRRDNSTSKRALDWPATILNLLLAWGFGLIILAFLWYLSLPARTFWMSGIAAASFIMSLLAAAGSLETMIKRLRNSDQTQKIRPFKRRRDYPLLALGVVIASWATYLVTEGPTKYLAPLDLNGENIVERPSGWLSYQDARNEFRSNWCRREFIEVCSDLGGRAQGFADEFDRRRRAALADMRRPDWQKPSDRENSMDFRDANVSNSFLPAINLTGSKLQKARFDGANLEKAFLYGADLQQASFNNAQLQGAGLDGAKLQDAFLSGAQLQEAQMLQADLSRARLSDTKLQKAFLWQSNFFAARLDSVDLSEAELRGATLDYSKLTHGTFTRTDLRGSENRGGMLRSLDLTSVYIDDRTDFRNTFLDGSVTLADAFRAQMGDPCQWSNAIIEDSVEFYGRWRGWVEAAPGGFEAPTWREISTHVLFLSEPGKLVLGHTIPAIPPPPGCAWKTGPMPGVAAEP